MVMAERDALLADLLDELERGLRALRPGPLPPVSPAVSRQQALAALATPSEAERAAIEAARERES